MFASYISTKDSYPEYVKKLIEINKKRSIQSKLDLKRPEDIIYKKRCKSWPMSIRKCAQLYYSCEGNEMPLHT